MAEAALTELQREVLGSPCVGNVLVGCRGD